MRVRRDAQPVEINAGAEPRVFPSPEAQRVTPPPAALRALGVATPDVEMEQDRIGDALAAIWGLGGAALARWRRIIAHSGVESRRAVLPLEEIVGMGTRDRMEAYERLAPALAARAAATALERAGLRAADITDLIVVSCTGFSAPGVDIELVRRLGLRLDVRRTIVGFMGCFGAISGLRTARAACAAEPQAAALVVCIELCSLHLRDDAAMDNQVASALFADGAAAAVVTGAEYYAGRGDARDGAIGRLTTGAGRIIPEGADWMTWRITDAGFAMTLTRDVPPAIRDHIGAFLAADDAGDGPNRSCIVHPGGPGVLDAVESALDLQNDTALHAARDTLRRHGNMSSATIFFVLEEALRRGVSPPHTLLAFGPGLSMERLSIVSE